MRLHKRLFGFACLVGLALLTACGNLTPPQQAYALNKEYQAAGGAVLAVLKTDGIPAAVKTDLKAADNVAFNYVTRSTDQAKAWNDAPDDQKPVEATVFEQLIGIARDSVGQLTVLLQKKPSAAAAEAPPPATVAATQ